MPLKAETKIYRAALYMRLSKDDEGSLESSSISNQRKMLRCFATDNSFVIYDEYIDDGYSGTSFDRPAFQRMLKDIESGYVNMVITKDLSRLGRDYITAGQYTEMYFPEHGIRYIAINDGYDSNNQYNDIAPFKHVINEMYARDTSKKIRSAFAAKMKEGSFIGNFAPYGYLKDPNNKNHLVINHEVATVVQEMFRMAENGYKPSEIARLFNDRGIMTPAVYRCKTYSHLNQDNYSKRKEWTSSIICKMLRNTVYIGHMAQGKTTKVSFKSNVTLSNSKNDWYIVKNTHEPLVSEEIFNNVHNRCLSRKNSPKNQFKNIFSGIAKCMDCGRNMSTTGTRKMDSAANLVCGGYKLYGKKECTNHFIDYETLYSVVQTEIRRMMSLSQEEKQNIAGVLWQERQNSLVEFQNKKTIEVFEARNRELDKIIQRLYEDNFSGKINDERFRRLLNTYETEQKDLTTKIEMLNIKASRPAFESLSNFLDLLETQLMFETLTPGLVNAFIRRIEIGQGEYVKGKKLQNIKLFYNFSHNL